MNIRRLIVSQALGLAVFMPIGTTFAQEAVWPAKTYYRYQTVNGHRLFYRESGDPGRPTLLLLHGYPSSSHTYRELIPLLSGRYHVIAPDDLGSGHSDRPDPDQTTYTFDMLADHSHGLIKALGIKEYVLYMQDFGAPVGYRVMLRDPGRLKGLIVQNANAYMDGLTPQRRAFFKDAHEDRSPAGIAKLSDFVSRESIINRQYRRDVKGKEEIMSPDSWTHDLAFLSTVKDRKIQVQLFQDYYNNLWSTVAGLPEESQPPTLTVGKTIRPSSRWRRRIRATSPAELHLIDAGIAVEEQPVVIAKHIVRFMDSCEARRRITRAQVAQPASAIFQPPVIFPGLVRMGR